MRLIDALSSAPARAFGLDAGALGVGVAADVTVIDPERTWTVRTFVSKSRNSPFVGREIRGAVAMTVVNGRIVYEG
jgi:dihydroorotase